RQVVVVGRDHPGVAERAEVFGRVEAETAEVGEAAAPLDLVVGPQRLGRVLDDADRVPGGDVFYRPHVRTLAEQVDRDDRPGAVGDLVLYLVRVEVEGERVDVGEDRAGAEPADAAGG